MQDMMGFWIFGGLAVLSAGLNLWQWWLARRFPLHVPVPTPGGSPAVSLLKPLKGCERDTENCLRSWFAQQYRGDVELLFAVSSADDPVCEVVQRLKAEFPEVRAQLLVCAHLIGANAKVSKLARLAREARHGILVVSDADVLVPPDFLNHLMAILAPNQVGLVFPFYRLANPQTFAMRWEAVMINADFWSQVLQRRSLKPLDFALGAVMAFRKEDLQAIGNFEALANHLADDYQLGHRIARLGRRIEICPVVVDCWEPLQGWRSIWAHQLRWARTIRVSQPGPYFLSIIANATLWPLLFVVSGSHVTWSFETGLAAVAAGHSFQIPVAVMVFGVCLLLRIVTAWHLQVRLTTAPLPWAQILMAPVKDLLQVLVWAGAFMGNVVVWRGVRYRVKGDGSLDRLG